MRSKTKSITCFKCGQQIIMDRDFWDAMSHLPSKLIVSPDCGAVLFKKLEETR